MLRNILSGILKKQGRELAACMIAWGQALSAQCRDDDGWSYRFLVGCYLVDIEARFSGGEVWRGPLYALFLSPRHRRTLVAKCNWLACRGADGDEWRYGGAGDLIMHSHGKLHHLPNGDAWFVFDGGHAVIFSGTPREKLMPKGDAMSSRIYGYF